MKTLTITITSETDDEAGLLSSLHEVVKWVEGGNRMGRGENDTESFEWVIHQ